MANKERRLKALHYLAKMELDSCKIFQGNRKPSSKLITLLSLSSLPLPPLPQEEEDNDDDRKLEELRNSVSPTTPLKYSSTIPSSPSSLEDSSAPPIQPQRPKTLVIKEGNKKQKINQKSKANNRSKTTTNTKGKEQVNYPPRDMPKHMFDLITGNDVQGKNIRWYTTKLIYESDICSGQNRLLLPNTEKLEEVLTSDEIKRHIEVHVFDPKLVIRKLTMGYWSGAHKYSLITLWSELAAANGLIAKGHLVDIWTFRNQLEQLCFVVDFRKVHKDEEEREDDEDPTGAAGTCGASTSGHGGCEGSTSISNNV